MGPKTKKIGRRLPNKYFSKLLWRCMLFAPIAFAGYSSCKPAIFAIIASNSIKSDSLTDGLNDFHQTFSQRKIQRHYLDYGIYIPIDDIIVNRGGDTNPSLIKMLERTCGRSPIYIWVPIRFRVPLAGEKVFEWCLTMS